MVKFVLPYIHFDDIKPSDTYQKLVFSMCVSKHYSWALATSLFKPHENATLGNAQFVDLIHNRVYNSRESYSKQGLIFRKETVANLLLAISHNKVLKQSLLQVQGCL